MAAAAADVAESAVVESAAADSSTTAAQNFPAAFDTDSEPVYTVPTANCI